MSLGVRRYESRIATRGLNINTLLPLPRLVATATSQQLPPRSFYSLNYVVVVVVVRTDLYTVRFPPELSLEGGSTNMCSPGPLRQEAVFSGQHRLHLLRHLPVAVSSVPALQLQRHRPEASSAQPPRLVEDCLLQPRPQQQREVGCLVLHRPRRPRRPLRPRAAYSDPPQQPPVLLPVAVSLGQQHRLRLRLQPQHPSYRSCSCPYDAVFLEGAREADLKTKWNFRRTSRCEYGANRPFWQYPARDGRRDSWRWIIRSLFDHSCCCPSRP